MSTRTNLRPSCRARSSCISYRPNLQSLESRLLLANNLFIAPTAASYALVGRAFSQDFGAYGPDTLSKGPYTYKLTGDVDGLTFAVHDNIATLSGTPAKKGTFGFTIDFTSGGGANTGSQEYTLSVGEPTVAGINLLTTNLAPLPQAIAGQPYGHYLHAAGGNGNYNYTFPNEVNGLSFFPYGNTITVSGTPKTAGTFSFTIGTTDSAGHTGSQTFTVDTAMGLFPGNQFAPGNLLAQAYQGIPYRQVITALGGTGAVSFTAPPSVAGMSLKVEEGVLVLSGTPTSAATFPFTVTVKDSANHTATTNYSLTVVATPVSLQAITANGLSSSPYSLAPAQAGVSYVQTFQAVGGDGNYSFTFPDGTANGMTVTQSGAQLVLQGTPTTPGTFGYLLTVQDGQGSSSIVQQFQLNVSPAANPSGAFSLTPSATAVLPAGTVNVPFSETFTAYNATGAYHFFTGSNTVLPPGLSLLADGQNYVLSGTPTMPGTYPLSIFVESDGVRLNQTYVLTIKPSGALTLTRDVLPPGMQGFPLVQALISNAASAAAGGLSFPYLPYQLTAAGGSGVGYRYSATGLPAGMYISATGQLGGTPAVVGNYSIVVDVTDSGGNHAQKTYAFSVIPTPTFVQNPWDSFTGPSYTPALIQQALGFNKIILSGGIIGTGKGQTIAVLESYDEASFVSSIPGLTLDRPDQVSYANSDMARLSTQLGLPQFASSVGTGAPVFVKLDSQGGTNYPINPYPESEGEFAGDVATIHALAPEANIIVFVAPLYADEQTLNSMYRTMMSFPYNLPNLPEETKKLLAGLPPVSVVSSSVYYQFNEAFDEVSYEQGFQSPFPGTQPATVVIAAGDTGYFPPALTGPQYPGNSANVISAAMTQPLISFDGQFLGQIGVSGAGGGPSLYLPQPAYQNGIVDAYSTTTRVNADVGFSGSFNSGMLFLNNGVWETANGSSNAAPAWSALMAIINQGRELLGQQPFDGPTQALPQLYSLPATDFYKLSQLDDGTNVPTNFNIASGLGTPIVNRLVPGMLGGHDTISGKLSDIDSGVGLAGWVVYLDANNNGTFDPGVEGSTTTAADGLYSFLVSPGTNYRVRVALPVGSPYGLLTDNPVSVSFSPGADHTASGLDFLFSSTADGFYVASLYTHVLGRTPDLAGSSSWVQKLQGGATRLQVATGFWESAEHRGIQVDSYYVTYFNRASDPAGKANWVQALVNGASETAVQVAFLTSAEYTQAHASNTAFVDGLYTDVLRRAPDASGATAWITALNSNQVTRAFAAMNFLTSPEEDGRIVDSFYEDLLGRAPDPAGQEAWVNALQAGTMSQDQIAEQFLASDEFFANAAADKGLSA